MSASTCAVLKRYIQERTRIFPATPQDPLFVNLQGRRLFLQIVYTAFRQALSRCGLRGGKGIQVLASTTFATAMPAIALRPRIARAGT